MSGWGVEKLRAGILLLEGTKDRATVRMSNGGGGG
jgi:hypothetical protein